MPWASLAAARKAAPSLLVPQKGKPIKSLAQANAIAAVYDGLKDEPGIKSAAATAKGWFKQNYTWTGSAWAKKVAKTVRKQTVGSGLGGQGGAYAAGPGGKCVCPSCGATKTKSAGTACTSETCPSCGAAMQRAGLPGPAKTTKELIGMDAVAFSAGARFAKADEKGEDRYLTIIASDTGPDRQGGHDPLTGERWKAERVTQKFLDKMKKAAAAGSIELNSSHQSAVPLAFSVGVADTADLDASLIGPYGVFAPIFKIEANSADGKLLWEMARDGKNQREFSIGGRVTNAYVAHDAEVGGMVKFLDDGVVTHVAVCRPGEAAVPRTGLAGAMVKAMTDAGLDWDKLADEAEKAYVTSSGDVEISSTDIREAEASAYEYPETPDFMENLQAIRMREELPKLNALLRGTFDEIDRDDEVEDKRAAKIKAVNDHEDALETLLTKAVTDEELRSIVDNAQGGTDMGMFASRSDEERTKIAKLLEVAEDKLDEFGLEDLLKLDADKREALEKAFIPVPALAATDLSSVTSGLLHVDEVASLFKVFAEATGLADLRKENEDLKAAADKAEEPAATEQPAATVVAEAGTPAEAATVETGEPVKEDPVKPEDVRSVVTEIVNKAMGAQSPSVEGTEGEGVSTDARANIEKLLGEGMSPADAMDAAFSGS